MSEPKTEKSIEKTPTVVVLLNNQPRLELIQLPGTNEMLRIMPGLNLMPSDTLRELRKNPSFETKFSTKIVASRAQEAADLRVGSPMLEQGKEVPERAPFSKLPDPEARELVSRLNDEELLERILQHEGRSEIRAALEERKKFLKTGTTDEA
jgi:hypothetical protein